MVSDVCSELVIHLDRAVKRLDSFLTDEEPYRSWYSGDLRARIIALRNESDAIRYYLDSDGGSRPALPAEVKP